MYNNNFNVDVCNLQKEFTAFYMSNVKSKVVNELLKACGRRIEFVEQNSTSGITINRHIIGNGSGMTLLSFKKGSRRVGDKLWNVITELLTESLSKLTLQDFPEEVLEQNKINHDELKNLFLEDMAVVEIITNAAITWLESLGVHVESYEILWIDLRHKHLMQAADIFREDYFRENNNEPNIYKYYYVNE